MTDTNTDTLPAVELTARDPHGTPHPELPEHVLNRLDDNTPDAAWRARMLGAGHGTIAGYALLANPDVVADEHYRRRFVLDALRHHTEQAWREAHGDLPHGRMRFHLARTTWNGMPTIEATAALLPAEVDQ